MNKPHVAPQPVNSLALIKSKLPNLADAEREVANLVLLNPAEIIHLSMAQIAMRCGVSDTTVLRFCRSVGFTGFTEFKFSVARDIASPTQIVHDDITETDEPIDIARKVFMAHVQSLYDTMEILDGQALQQAVDMILEAGKIQIVGVGTSNVIVNETYNRFFRLGLNCHAQTDSYLQLMEASLLEPSTLVIAISQSGASIDPVLGVEEAKRNGASVIVITGTSESPLAKLADVVLVAVSSETRSEKVASRIAQMTLVDALYIATSFRLLDRATENENKIWTAIGPKAY